MEDLRGKGLRPSKTQLDTNTILEFIAEASLVFR